MCGALKLRLRPVAFEPAAALAVYEKVIDEQLPPKRDVDHGRWVEQVRRRGDAVGEIDSWRPGRTQANAVVCEFSSLAHAPSVGPSERAKTSAEGEEACHAGGVPPRGQHATPSAGRAAPAGRLAVRQAQALSRAPRGIAIDQNS